MTGFGASHVNNGQAAVAILLHDLCESRVEGFAQVYFIHQVGFGNNHLSAHTNIYAYIYIYITTAQQHNRMIIINAHQATKQHIS
jgi:hypothetical protein